ncbi:hypothetical protein [Bacillus arachidis]|uniref:Uncharacterized protein n=1 Tax=Bacillus arachidis TaxID=2819290 RepID=A0ABS3P4R9_9BACI|nr:hypothetical protein [Bacillus arachidis]MBO1628176.1 hypothetical protein [Bacillus arachidis]
MKVKKTLSKIACFSFLVTSLLTFSPAAYAEENSTTNDTKWWLQDPNSSEMEAKWLENLGTEFEKEYRTYDSKKQKEILNEFYNAAVETEKMRKEFESKKDEKQIASSRWTGESMGTMGDALVSLESEYGKWGFVWGHAAIVADDKRYAFEANPGEGVKRKYNKWNNHFRDKHALYVKGASTAKNRSAQHYAWQQ